MRQPAMAAYTGKEISPGEGVQTDAELDEFVRQNAETSYHPCGSNAMGYDDMAVVDAQGRVHGNTSSACGGRVHHAADCHWQL
ncbi:Oxygen-dependent choline dehydrogenase [Polaromonas vacuolata]|uniref:Oxygen-dependent choline dehydrogenase n=1 Tax=Polaromonas vacuolata TaxID=37448 RepID=A0A6H2H9V7_9BURK|nr:Oxygen-dependent choline dehydrogenase [Polaromonas vacuolata]